MSGPPLRLATGWRLLFTGSDGEIFRFEPRMTMPFVGEGVYSGVVIFVASSL